MIHPDWNITVCTTFSGNPSHSNYDISLETTTVNIMTMQELEFILWEPWISCTICPSSLFMFSSCDITDWIKDRQALSLLGYLIKVDWMSEHYCPTATQSSDHITLTIVDVFHIQMNAGHQNSHSLRTLVAQKLHHLQDDERTGILLLHIPLHTHAHTLHTHRHTLLPGG